MSGLKLLINVRRSGTDASVPSGDLLYCAVLITLRGEAGRKGVYFRRDAFGWLLGGFRGLPFSTSMPGN